MPYLVDGNNVMAQNIGWHTDKQRARYKLIRDLVKFVAVTRTKLKVVFDGSPDDKFPEGIRYKGVQVLYARTGSDADSRILELVKKATYKRDLIVVTSDKPLGSKAKHYGAQVISSGNLRQMIQEAYEIGPEKPDEKNSIDVDEWLEYFEQGQ
jgi:predicted RNA-binding protein with PIN domain